jgi:hypothetical protein
LNLKQITFILFAISGILALYTVLLTSITYFDLSDWGLLSRLPVTYWLGLALACVALFLNMRKGYLNTKISLIFIIFIYIYVCLIPVIIEKPVGFSANSLWPASESNLLVETGRISVGQPRMLMSYESWPFFTIFASFLRIMTGLPLIFFSKWFPLFTIMFWSILIFLLLKRYFVTQYAILGACIFICSSWTKQQYFGPQSYSFFFFIIFLYLISDLIHGFRINKCSTFGLTFIIFTSALFSHALTSIVLMLIMVLFFMGAPIFLKNGVKLLKSIFLFFVSCVVAMLSYIIYVSPRFFNSAFNSIVSVINDIGELRTIQQFNRLPGSEIQQFTNMSTFLIIGAFVSVSAISIFHMLRKKTVHRNQLFFWLCCLCVLFIVTFMPYGEEGPFRAFIFGLPFFSLFTIYLLRKKPILLYIFLLTTLFLGFIALYGSDSYRLATEPELLGTQYCANNLPAGMTLLYKFSPYIRYYDPTLSIRFEVLGKPPFVSLDPSSIEQALNYTDFIVVSRNQVNYYNYYLDIDPFSDEFLAKNLTLSDNVLYNNGNFTLYAAKYVGEYNE